MTRNIRATPFFRMVRDEFCNFNLRRKQFNHPIHLLSRHSTIGGLKTSSVVHSFTSNTIAKRASFTSSIEPQGDAHTEKNREFEDDEVDEDVCSEREGDPGSSDRKAIMDVLQIGGSLEKSKKLQQCGVNVTPALVANVLSSTRNDWETAFTFFLWAGNQLNYEHSLREYHSMIAILGKFRKFDTAWTLIEDMRVASIVTPYTLLIMMRKYAAVHDVAKAISTFYAHRRFNFKIGMEEFQGLLSVLSRYKNVKDAEHLLFCNRTVFPLNTKSFNIILNGWCNVIGDLREGKRIWRAMEVWGVKHDVYSYASIMSCHSKMNNLNAVLGLYERMKALGMKPDRKVYNAVIHALAKGRLVKEARNVMVTMQGEGITPDAVTYNSLIMPLCKSQTLDEAHCAFDEMLERGLCPTVRTFHGFFRVLRTKEEVFERLQKMHKIGCSPSHDTYVMLLRKFCRWREVDTVFKLWSEMSDNGLDPDRCCYTALIHGLFLNGRLEEAHKYYLEMKDKDLLPEPSLDAMLGAWMEGKNNENKHVVMSKDRQFNRWDIGENMRVDFMKSHKDDNFLQKPELRSVIRERGFSFWKN